MNRLFSIQQVHNTLLKSFVVHGHDEGRPQVGVAIECRDPAKRDALVKYNKSLVSKSPLMPSVVEGEMRYEGLACTHYNVALRLVDQARSSPAGDLAKLKDTDESLAYAAKHGHQWIILPEDTADNLKKDIATWKNADQNENQPLTDGELVRLALVAVEGYIAKAAPGKAMNMPLNQIILAASLSTPKVVKTMESYCKFVCAMVEEGKNTS